jgi:ATP-dependent RNA helicase HelY
VTELARFAAGLDFDLDPFQVEGCAALEAGRGVLVAAPTGAGKTVVGEFAVHLALASGRKAFYTTPIKALSNQKYADLVRRHGAANVGLLTGDSSVNGEAPVVVMTTEVLRNMMYAGSPTLSGLGYVVMDEVHYLADRFRGAVWEEVIIHLPEDVLVVSLSATVSNAEEFGEWLGEVRGDVAVVVSEIRPVPLWQHVMVGKSLFDLFSEESLDASGRPQEGGRVEVNPELLQRIRSLERALAMDAAAHRGPRGRESGIRPGGGPPRADVIATLDREGLLPAITFVFSRNGCDAAVGQLLARGTRLVTDEEGVRNRRYVQERIGALADEDLSVLGYWDFVDGIERGFAAHHAGMLPTFREIVEELFTQGRVRAVFATETLALGINMPARTVVLEKLVKFNGDTHAELTAGEYTQLTGRAGRRGIDVEGHGVVLWTRGLDPTVVGGLASTRTYPLRSSFRPTYNMAVNLVAQVGRERAREVLETSFAQFQADRSVVGLARAVRRGERQLAEYAAEWHCHLGDFGEYAALRAALRDLEKGAAKARSAATRAEAELSLERLRPGDVIRVPTGRRAGYAVVVATNRGAPGRPVSPAVVTEDRQLRRLTTVDVPTPVQPLLTVRIPPGFNAKSPKSRRDLAATLRIAVAHEPPPRHTSRGAQQEVRRESDAEISRLRAALREHPCHACPDREEHARRAEKWWRLRRETDGLARQVDGRTNTVARTFDRICDLLEDLGYLGEGGRTVTAAGEDLRRIYAERDLLTAQCIREGVWNRLDAAGLAAVVSALIHEPRRDDLAAAPRVPTTDVGEALTAMTGLWATLQEQERRHGLPPSGAPDAGIVWMVHRWASGQRLETVLRGSDLAAGDFVRRCKQVVDLLGQIGDIAPHPALSAKARKAVDAVRRGVVAADRID